MTVRSNNNKIAPALLLLSSSAPCVMKMMERLLLMIVVMMVVMANLKLTTTTTTTAFSPPPSFTRSSGAVFRGGGGGGSSSSISSKTTITGTTIVMSVGRGGQQDQHQQDQDQQDQNHQHHITPMDGERFQYLDPLKQFPSNELKAKLEKHNNMIYHLALCPSTSNKFVSLPPSNCSIGGNGISGISNNRKALVKHSAGLLVPPPISSLSLSSSSTTTISTNGGSSSHFQSHRKDLGWYAENEQIPTNNNIQMYYGDKDFFEFNKLTSNGLRKNLDIGTPEDYSRSLCDDIQTNSAIADNTNTNTNTISCGSWYCTKGGWPSKTPRATTEIFYVLSGFGCLTDIDGQRNYFSPGDTVILPKHWSGRWDIAENIHKIWFIHDHNDNEEEDTTTSTSSSAGTSTSSTITRVKIIHYNELVSTTNKDELIIGPNNVITKLIYNIGPTNVMISTSVPSYFVVTPRLYVDCFHILEGSMTILDGEKQIAVNVGDTVVLPIGWTGRFNVKETIKALRIKV